jgi:tRNA modification GTPase
MSRGDIIFALASGPPPSGIALFRISGPNLEALMLGLVKKKLQPRMAEFGPVFDPQLQNVIDYGLALWFPAPKSFTGDDCLELHLHGSRAVQLALTKALAAWPNCRLAQPGEFTLRALRNGKLNLMEVEAISDLLTAETEAQRFQAVSSFSGLAGHIIENWREELIKALSLIEASLDFSDEGDIPSDLLVSFRQGIENVQASLLQSSQNIGRAELIRDGFRVAIIGPPNAGKSSFLNYIAGRDVAIVSDYAGTTRDVLDVKISLDGLPVVFYDTAGLRETHDPVEKLGIERTKAQIEHAHLILCLDETGRFIDDFIPRTKPSIRIRTKIDLNKTIGDSDFSISTKTGEGISALLNHIESQAKELTTPYEPIVFFNQRQNVHIQSAIQALDRIKKLDLNSQTEFIAEDIRSALQALEGLIGKVDAEDILGNIFSSFCIGK